MTRWWTQLPGPRVRHAWQAAVAAALINVVGMLFELGIGAAVPGVASWPALLSIGVGTALLLLLILVRWSHVATTRLFSAAFVVNTAAIALALWVTSGAFAAAGRAFQAHKLGALLVALLAPEPWAGVVSIAAYVGTALIGLVTFDARVRAHVPPGEAWVLAAHAAIALLLLLYRWRGLTVARKLARAHAEAVANERVARALLAVRDLANTPVQTIALNVALLRARRADHDGAELERIGRALDRLHELNHALKAGEAHLRWSDGDESFDPGTVLRNGATPGGGGQDGAATEAGDGRQAPPAG